MTPHYPTPAETERLFMLLLPVMSRGGTFVNEAVLSQLQVHTLGQSYQSYNRHPSTMKLALPSLLAVLGLSSLGTALSIVDQIARLPWKGHPAPPHKPHHPPGPPHAPKKSMGPYETLIDHCMYYAHPCCASQRPWPWLRTSLRHS